MRLAPMFILAQNASLFAVGAIAMLLPFQFSKRTDRVVARVLFTDFSVALALLIVVTTIYLTAAEAHRKANLVEDTGAAMVGLGELKGLLSAELAEHRAYLLSGDPSYIDRRQASLQHLDSHIEQFRALISDPAQRERVRQFRALMAERIEFQQYTIDIYRNQGQAAALLAFNHTTPKVSVAQLNDKLDEMMRVEALLLNQLRDEEHSDFNRLQLVTISIVLLVLIGMVYSAWLIRREVLRRTQSEQAEHEALLQLKQSQEMLVRSEKLAAMGVLVGGVAHEINNPLMGLAGYIGYARDNIGEEKPREMLGKALKEVERIAHIVKSLLVFGRQSATVQQSEVREVAERVLSLAETQCKTANVRCRLALPPDLPQVAISGDGLQQVILNLLLNARDALQDCPLPREIEVSAAALAADKVEIYVSDNGQGVPEAIRWKIFDPFFTTKPPGSGTGLGLAVSRQMAEAVGGQLELAESEVGARFVLRLPVAVKK